MTHSTTKHRSTDHDTTVVDGPGSLPWPYDRPPDRVRWHQELSSHNPEQAAGAALCLGRLAAAELRMEEAAVLLSRAAEYGVPAVVPRAYYQLVAVLQALGRDAEAEAALEAAHTASDPEHTADVSVDVAAVLSSRGLHERAIEVLRAVVDGWRPGAATGASDVGDLIRATAALRLGILYEQSGRVHMAIDAWQLALDANYPAVTPVAALRLAEVYLRNEDNYRPAVIEDLLRVATDFDHPTASPRAALWHADFLERHDQITSARALYDMLAQSDSDVAAAAGERLRRLREPGPVTPAPVPSVMHATRKPIIIVGAGTGGRYLLRDLAKDRFEVVGFVDDHPSAPKVHGIPVLGTVDGLDGVLAQIDNLYAVLIAIPTISGTRRRVAVEACLKHGVRVENLPSMFELHIRRKLGRQVRPVRVEDVLGRAPLEVDRRAGDLVRGRSVLITGAGSTLGHELARQTAQARARQLALTDVSDARMLSVLRELRRDRGFERVFGVVSGVDRPDVMSEVLATHRPELVFHAASRDHMELMEENPVETIRTNTLALYDFARACGKAGIQRFVLVGSHDAASMRGVLDASKLLAEQLLGVLQEEFPFTDYLTIRVGNLYRSPNSVVRVFEEQIDRGSSVTVVRGAERRFMRADLAAQTVLQVSHYGGKGKRYALTGGDTMSIADLAELIIRLRGYRSGDDVEIETIAPRYGDRQAVNPYGKHERRLPTDIPKVLEVITAEPDREFLLPLVARVHEAVHAYDARRVHQLVLDAMPQLMTTARPVLH